MTRRRSQVLKEFAGDYMEIGYLGPQGTYTEQAAQQAIVDLGIRNATTSPLSPIISLFAALFDNTIQLAIGVHSESKASEIEEIWSKDTALKGCSKYMNIHFPNARRFGAGGC